MSALKTPVRDPVAEEPGPTAQHGSMTRRTLGPFLAITFGLGWGTGMLLAFFGEQIEAVFGEIGPTNPVYLLLVYSPAIAAVYLVARR